MACGQHFTGGFYVSSAQIWEEYTTGKQTYKQLSAKYKCSTKTIERRFDSYRLQKTTKIPREVIVIMDTAYWGMSFGVKLSKDSISKENHLKYYVIPILIPNSFRKVNADITAKQAYRTK
ncbi:MAG: hypothetical protein PF448_08095 [Bacteroidales bacterium]|jgi:hypothetical protein|nr:hypothetical protein [Bacteroidales bacterium]